MRIERHRGAIRVVLLYLAVTIGVVAVWILVAPRNFYDEFPPGSAHWVSALPPYNEHLERDYGSAGLGLALLALLAAVWMERRLVQAACIVLFAGTLPHAIYHATTTESLSTRNNVLNLGGLFLEALLPLLILYLASDRARRPAAQGADATLGTKTPKEA